MSQKIFSPQELIKYYQSLVDGVSAADFFTKPYHSKSQEVWCAAYFSQAYEKHVNPCSILLEEIDAQTDTDFELIVKDKRYPFQITETQEPGRKRGDEYKQNQYTDWETDDWTPGTENGPTWIRAAIEKKINKRYSNPKELNLLIYANYFAWGHNYNKIVDATKDLYNVFASIWLINGNAICSLHSFTKLGFTECWQPFEE